MRPLLLAPAPPRPAKRPFLASLCHEMNNMLSPLVLLSEFLREDAPARDWQRDFKEIRRSVRRLEELGRCVSALSDRTSERERADLNHSVKESLESIHVRRVLQEEGARIDLDVSPLPTEVLLSRLHLGWVLSVLAHVLCRAPDADKVLTLRTGPHPRGGGILRLVSRAGALEPDQARHLFEAGYARKDLGWDVGSFDLPAVAHLLRLMKARLRVTSPLGFEIVFPPAL